MDYDYLKAFYVLYIEQHLPANKCVLPIPKTPV